ncbi:hypothetical protein ANCDUO_06344 [Ancylostoma duodenale]|uniref:Uncharacterized protein n=1 Tax=Ancylostoma duodenale TaxID=51022 RepID=A0A0C2D1X7_9BILA|nr:hypothetical protein ANCDUO_06344 [Ancylostoma duodenale]
MLGSRRVALLRLRQVRGLVIAHSQRPVSRPGFAPVDARNQRVRKVSTTSCNVAKLLGDPKEDLTLLSDRQLAVLLSAFGNACESVSSLRRAALMSQALQALQQRGV